MNPGDPFLIYDLCKRAGVPLEDNEAWIHPIKAISIKRDKPGVPRPEGVYDLGNEPSDEEEFREYKARFDLSVDSQGDVGLSSTHPPPPTHPTLGAVPSSPTPDLEDPVLALTDSFGAFWDETQEHRVLITQDMEAIHADMRTVLANQATILQNQQALQAQLAQLLALHQPPLPLPQCPDQSQGKFPSPSTVLLLPVETLDTFVWGVWVVIGFLLD